MNEILPKNWEVSSFGWLIIFALGGDWGNKPEAKKNGWESVIVLRGTEFKNWASEKGITAVHRIIKKDSLLKRELLLNDFVIEISGGGPKQPVGRVLYIDEQALYKSEYPLICSNFCRKVRLTSLIVPKYVYFNLNHQYSRGSFNQYQNNSVNIRNLQFDDFCEGVDVPLAPLNEQKRIVAKLNQIMLKIDGVKERLERIPQIIKRFRQSVLTDAITGKLTEKWREEHPDVESAEDLLERIRKRRVAKYKKACDIAKKNGKRKPQSRYLLKIPEINYGLRTDIPGSWVVTNVDFLAWVTKLAGFEYTEYINFSKRGEIPVVRAQNVQMGKFVEENIVYIDKKTSDILDRSRLFGNEIMMVFIGAGTGNVCMCPSGKRWHLAPNVAKIDVDYIFNKFLHYYLQSPLGVENTLNFIKATAQPSLSMGTIRKIVVQIPSLEEQKEIVRQVDKLFSFADKLKDHYKKAKEKVDKFPQSVLAKAFRGELVPQDPNDEPAEKLLERIQEEKAKMACLRVAHRQKAELKKEKKKLV